MILNKEHLQEISKAKERAALEKKFLDYKLESHKAILAQEKKLDKLIYKIEQEKIDVVKSDSDFDSQQALEEGKFTNPSSLLFIKNFNPIHRIKRKRVRR